MVNKLEKNLKKQQKYSNILTPLEIKNNLTYVIQHLNHSN